MSLTRCTWVKSEIEQKYHDTDWGVPKHDDYTLFYMLVLEGMQAGLSWSTILQKWDGFFDAFDQFDLDTICNYSEEKVQSLLINPAIIRNKLKIRSTITNAEAFKRVQEEFGSFDQYIWKFVHNTPIQNKWKDMNEIPASTPLSEEISKDLKKRGFKFVGPTIVYAYMQSIGMVNDHLVSCSFYNTSTRT